MPMDEPIETWFDADVLCGDCELEFPLGTEMLPLDGGGYICPWCDPESESTPGVESSRWLNHARYLVDLADRRVASGRPAEGPLTPGDFVGAKSISAKLGAALPDQAKSPAQLNVLWVGDDHILVVLPPPHETEIRALRLDFGSVESIRWNR